MSIDAAPRTPRGPVRRAERALAPDLARGAMLLIIALANVAGVVFAGQPGLDATPEGVDRGLNFLLFELVHARGYPVFAVMFGYGLVQLARRQDASGATPKQVRSVLLRRHLWLVVFGFAHAALLYYGDFLGAYGIVGIAMTLLLLRRGDQFHRIALALWALAAVEVLVIGAIVVSGIGGSGGAAPLPSSHVDSLAAPGYLASVLDRLGEWPMHTLTVLPFIIIAWLGMWAARRRVLEEPARHKTLLKWTAVLGLSSPSPEVSRPLCQCRMAARRRVGRRPDDDAPWRSGMFAGPGYGPSSA